MNTTPSIDHSIVFDIAYYSAGGKWDLDNHSNFLTYLLTYIQSIPGVIYDLAQDLYAKNMDTLSVPGRGNFALPPITFGLTNSQQLNCFAKKLDKHFYVAMNGFLPIACLEIACFYFSDHQFYPEIGDPKQQPYIQFDGIEEIPFYQLIENRYFPRIWDGLAEGEAENLYRSVCTVRGNTKRFDSTTGEMLSTEAYIAQNFTVIDLLRPRCPIRRNACNQVAINLATYFWLHEIAHVTRGHIALKSTLEDKELIQMFEFPNYYFGTDDDNLLDSEETRKLILAMEFDADIEAIMNTIGLILDDIDVEVDTSKAERYQRIELYVFFIVVMFAAITAHDRRIKRLSSHTHPPALYRLINIIKYLLAISTTDERLNHHVANAVKKAIGFSRWGKYSYIRPLFNFDKKEMEYWNNIDSLRDEKIIDSGSYHYGNLRIITPWLYEKMLDKGVMKKPIGYPD
jgi:hypothetical protein